MSTWTLLCLQICCLLGWQNTSSSSTQARSVTSSHQENVGTSERMHFSSALPSLGCRHGRIPGRISGNRRNQRGARKPFEVLQVHRVRQDCSRRPSVQQIRHGGDLFSGSHCSVGGDFQVPRDGDYPRLNAGYPLLEADPRGSALLRFLSVWLYLSLSFSLFIYLYICLSIHLSISLPSMYLSLISIIHPSLYPPISFYLSLSIHISFYPSLSIHRSIYLSIHVSIYPSLPIHLFINPSIFLSISISLYLSIYLSIHLCIYLFLFIYPSGYISIYLYPSFCLFIQLSLYRFIYPSIHPSLYPFINLSVSLYIYIYIRPCIFPSLSIYLPISLYLCMSVNVSISTSLYLLSFSPFCRAYSSTATAATWPWTRLPRYPRATSSSRPSSSTRNPSLRGQRRRRWI